MLYTKTFFKNIAQELEYVRIYLHANNFYTSEKNNLTYHTKNIYNVKLKRRL